MTNQNSVTSSASPSTSSASCAESPAASSHTAIKSKTASAMRKRVHTSDGSSNRTMTGDNSQSATPRDDSLQARLLHWIRLQVLKFAFPMQFVEKPPYPRAVAAVWYLTPERHLLESLFLIFIAFILLAWTHCFFASNIDGCDGGSICSYLTPFSSNNLDGADAVSCSKLDYMYSFTLYNPDFPLFANVTHFIAKWFLTLDLALHAYFKLTKMDPNDDLNQLLRRGDEKPLYNKNILWLLQPCAFSHLILIILHWVPSWHTIRANQYLMTCSTGTMSALLFPDTTHCRRFGEVSHFWLQHGVVFLLPYYYFLLQLGWSDENQVYALMACQDYALWLLYHFFFLEIMSITQGINLNYIMSPPPAGPAKKFGANYRLVTSAIIAVTCQLSGFIFPQLVAIVFYLVKWIAFS